MKISLMSALAFLMIQATAVSAMDDEIIKVKIDASAEDNNRLSMLVLSCIKDWIREQKNFDLVESNWDLNYSITGQTINSKQGAEMANTVNVIFQRSLFFGATKNQRREMIRDLKGTKIPFGVWSVSGQAEDLGSGMTQKFYGYAGPGSHEATKDRICKLWKDDLAGWIKNYFGFRNLYVKNGIDE
jgi:hypothetical protein